METINQRRTQVGAYDAIEVNSGPLAVTVVPDLGAKVSSLRDTRTGREWLWRHPRLAYQTVDYGQSYVAVADTGGWDECFPTVSACAYPSGPWSGQLIQDHGELWSQQADVRIEAGSDFLQIEARWRGVRLPYAFTRVLRLEAGSARVHARYTVHNDADTVLPFLWCIHPLLAIAPGMRLSLPSGARLHCAGQNPRDMGLANDGLSWPIAVRARGEDYDLSAFPDPAAAIAIKLWSDPLTRGEASLAAEDGALHMRWDPDLLPQVAVWMNLGAWAADGGAPYYNLGLEPCIGGGDSLADAVATGLPHGVLAPRASRAWWLELELST